MIHNDILSHISKQLETINYLSTLTKLTCHFSEKKLALNKYSFNIIAMEMGEYFFAQPTMLYYDMIY